MHELGSGPRAAAGTPHTIRPPMYRSGISTGLDIADTVRQETEESGYWLEGWPSGLRRTPGKRVYRVERYRGFESLSLRHLSV